MESIDEIIELIKVKQNFTSIIETFKGKTRNGQNFAILLREPGIQYAVHVIMDEPHFRHWKKNNLNNLLENYFVMNDWIITVKFFWKTTALQVMNEWKILLENGKYDEFLKNTNITDTNATTVTLPKECFLNPDKYLKIGDSVTSDIIPSPKYEGIYVGKGEVVHISTKLDLRGQPTITRTKLFPHSNTNEKRFICLKIFRVRYFSLLEIALIASKFAPMKMNKFCVAESDTKCLAFMSLCSFGYEYSKTKGKSVSPIRRHKIDGKFLALCIKDSDKNESTDNSLSINLLTPLATSMVKVGTVAAHHTTKAKSFVVIVKDAVPLDGVVNGFDTLTQIALPVAITIDVVRLGLAFRKDMKNDTGLRNTAVVTSSIAASWSAGYAGGLAGGKAGVALGTLIGSLFAGVGAAPGAVVGGMVGSIVGAIGCSVIASFAATRLTKAGIDRRYGKLPDKTTMCHTFDSVDNDIPNSEIIKDIIIYAYTNDNGIHVFGIDSTNFQMTRYGQYETIEDFVENCGSRLSSRFRHIFHTNENDDNSPVSLQIAEYFGTMFNNEILCYFINRYVLLAYIAITSSNLRIQNGHKILIIATFENKFEAIEVLFENNDYIPQNIRTVEYEDGNDLHEIELQLLGNNDFVHITTIKIQDNCQNLYEVLTIDILHVVFSKLKQNYEYYVGDAIKKIVEVIEPTVLNMYNDMLIERGINEGLIPMAIAAN